MSIPFLNFFSILFFLRFYRIFFKVFNRRCSPLMTLSLLLMDERPLSVFPPFLSFLSFSFLFSFLFFLRIYVCIFSNVYPSSITFISSHIRLSLYKRLFLVSNPLTLSSSKLLTLVLTTYWFLYDTYYILSNSIYYREISHCERLKRPKEDDKPLGMSLYTRGVNVLNYPKR